MSAYRHAQVRFAIQLVTTSEATLAWARARSDKLVENTTALGTRLAVWLVVGNAAALLFVFQRLLEKPAYLTLLKPAAFWFFSGLGLAFTGLAVSYTTSLITIFLNERALGNLALIVQNENYIDRLEERFPNHPVPEDAPLHQSMQAAAADAEKLKKPMARLWWLSALAILLQAAAAASFGLGATQPFRQDPVALTKAFTAAQATSGKQGQSTSP